MNKQTEALKMAIEELEDANNFVFQEWLIEGEYNNAIKSCKEALEQPSWQGLSDDEIDELPFYDYMTQEEINNVVRAIEQALKEKNS